MTLAKAPNLRERAKRLLERVRLLLPRLYGVIGLLTLLATLGQAVLAHLAVGAFAEFSKLPPGTRALLVLGLAAFDQVLAIAASLGFALALAAVSRPGSVRVVSLLCAGLFASVGLLLCLSNATHLYLGAFMDLAMLLDVLTQFRQWFVYAHSTDPRALYGLFGGTLGLFALMGWWLGRVRRSVSMAPGRPGSHGWLAAATSATGLLACLLLVRDRQLDGIFFHGLAPELHLAGRLLERPPPSPRVRRYPAERRQVSLQQYAETVARRPQRNVILVSVESWSSLHTGFLGAPVLATPNLDRLSRRSLILPHTVAASSHSEYAQAAVISSLHPLKYAYHDSYRGILYPRVLLADVFSKLGYRTAMFSSQDERWQNNLNFLLSASWDVLWFSLHFRGPHYGEGLQTKIHDEHTVEQALRWIRRAPEQPFFLYLNFQDTHFPYAPPSQWQVHQPVQMPAGWAFYAWPPGTQPNLQNRYANALLYLDAQIGKLLDELHTSGLARDTLLVIVGDHGENLGEGAPPPHCCRLMTAELRTPLLIHAPGLVTEQLDPRPVSTLDVAPIIAGRLGLRPHPGWQGVDALADGGERRRPIFVHSGIFAQVDAVVDWPWKLVINHTYRLSTLTNLELDWNERHNLLNNLAAMPEAADRFREMHRRLQDFRACQLDYYGDQALYRNFYVSCQ